MSRSYVSWPPEGHLRPRVLLAPPCSPKGPLDASNERGEVLGKSVESAWRGPAKRCRLMITNKAGLSGPAGRQHLAGGDRREPPEQDHPKEEPRRGDRKAGHVPHVRARRAVSPRRGSCV